VFYASRIFPEQGTTLLNQQRTPIDHHISRVLLHLTVALEPEPELSLFWRVSKLSWHLLRRGKPCGTKNKVCGLNGELVHAYGSKVDGWSDGQEIYWSISSISNRSSLCLLNFLSCAQNIFEICVYPFSSKHTLPLGWRVILLTNCTRAPSLAYGSAGHAITHCSRCIFPPPSSVLSPHSASGWP
jgi:hypothetical protein